MARTRPETVRDSSHRSATVNAAPSNSSKHFRWTNALQWTVVAGLMRLKQNVFSRPSLFERFARTRANAKWGEKAILTKLSMFSGASRPICADA